MKKALFFPLQVSLCTVSYLYASSSITHAQVTSDGTVDTQVTQDGNVAEITGGETRGSNLFHSFQDFSVPTSNEAFFNNANDISNIFSRVTGGNISNIDGLIRANDSANLFLINPAGIIFGQNARLDIGGSFYGSTASSILFEDGEFSAADLENPPLLTVNAPIGLGFRDNPGDIENNSVANNGRGLEVATGKVLALAGGDISFNGGKLTVPEGNIYLGGLDEAGIINLNDDGNLSFPENLAQSDIRLSNNATVIASNIFVRGNTLSLNRASLQALDFEPNNPSDNDGNISLKINRAIFMRNNSLIFAQARGDSNEANIEIMSRFLVGFPNQNNDILATSERGLAGDIDLQIFSILGFRVGVFGVDNLTNDIDASSNITAGFIEIFEPFGLDVQEVNLIESEQTNQQACEANREIAAKNGLNIKGKGGIVPEPGLPLNSLNVIVNGETNSTSTIPQPIETSQGKIQPARGIKVTESGKVILTAYRTNNSGDKPNGMASQRIPEIKRNCGQV